MNKILSKVERLTRSGNIYLIFREESIFSRFNFYYSILNVDAFQTRKLLVFFRLFGKVAYIRLFYLILLSCLNEIPARPQLRKNALSKDILNAWALLIVKNTLFFGVLCGRGDLPSSLIYILNSIKYKLYTIQYTLYCIVYTVYSRHFSA